jgi:hypothetical protein
VADKKERTLEEKHAQYLKGGRWKMKDISEAELQLILTEIEEQKRNNN